MPPSDLAMASDRYDAPGHAQVPQTHRAALAGVRWPSIPVRATLPAVVEAS